MKKLILLSGILTIALFVWSSCNKESIDESIELGNSFEMQKNPFSMNMAADEYGYNFQNGTFHGSVFNGMIGDPLNYGADFYGWKPYWGDDEAYLKLAEVENYTVTIMLNDAPVVVNFWENPDVLPFWQFRNMILKSKSYKIYDKQGNPLFPWIDTDAWISMHYYMGSGDQRWSQFQKFIAVKSTDYAETKEGEYMEKWYNQDDEEIGISYMWPNLALIEVVNTGNVPEGMLGNYKSPTHRGLSNK